MTFLYFILTTCFCTITVTSQQILGKNKLPKDDNTIYFLENGQLQNKRNDQQNTKSDITPHYQGDYVTEMQGQVSYLPNQDINFQEQYPNNNGNSNANNVKQPSLDLQPPSFSDKAGIDYHTSSPAPRVSPGSHLRNGNLPATSSVNPVQDMNSSHAVINFGLSLLKNIDGKGKNVVVSPYSVATILALLQQGALGATQLQITQALQMTPEMSQENFRKFSDEFQKRNSRNVLRVANNIYIADAFNLNPTFKRVAMRSFGSDVTPIRFAQPEQAVHKINNWVASKTNNKIQEILTTDSVGENTQMVLVNAVYFKGLWQVRFKPESTLPRPFHLDAYGDAGGGDVTKIVPFMRMRRMFKTGVDGGSKAQVIILPFENEQYSLMLVLPSELSSLNAMVSKLAGSQLAEYHNFSPKEVDLEIPKFTVRSDIMLNQVLGMIGITNIFSDKSELHRLGNYRTFSPQVSSALHSAMLSIDEDGGTAAAATAFAAVALSYSDPSVVFRANRPFLAVLWDSQEALPIFMAKVEDPSD